MHFVFWRGGAERLLTFPTDRLFAYSRWVLNRINTVTGKIILRIRDKLFKKITGIRDKLR